MVHHSRCISDSRSNGAPLLNFRIRDHMVHSHAFGNRDHTSVISFRVRGHTVHCIVTLLTPSSRSVQHSAYISNCRLADAVHHFSCISRSRSYGALLMHLAFEIILSTYCISHSRSYGALYCDTFNPEFEIGAAFGIWHLSSCGASCRISYSWSDGALYCDTFTFEFEVVWCSICNVSRQVSVPSCSKYLLMAGVRISVIYSVTSIAADSIGVLV